MGGTSGKNQFLIIYSLKLKTEGSSVPTRMLQFSFCHNHIWWNGVWGGGWGQGGGEGRGCVVANIRISLETLQNILMIDC